MKLFVSSLTVAEVYKNVLPGELIDTENLLRDFQTIDVNYDIAKHGGLYWNQHVREFRKLHIVDCIIAATAFENELELLTLNSKHFPMKDIRTMNPLKFQKR